MLVWLRASSMSPVMAVMASGVSCRFSLRNCAVTMTSSSVSESSAFCGCCACSAAAPDSISASEIARDRIPFCMIPPDIYYGARVQSTWWRSSTHETVLSNYRSRHPGYSRRGIFDCRNSRSRRDFDWFSTIREMSQGRAGIGLPIKLDMETHHEEAQRSTGVAVTLITSIRAGE
jgi:hypothetical protein